jgi:hypothetical protein
VAEQADQVLGVRDDLGAEAPVYLGQEKFLEVDDQAAATIRDNTFRHGRIVSLPAAVKTKKETSHQGRSPLIWLAVRP